MSIRTIAAVLIVISSMSLSFNLRAQPSRKPNIIFILTDDLGYGDVGVFFQNQRKQAAERSQPYELTPNLDNMAAAGAIFTSQYCNAPVCAPSRASLLTGVNQGNSIVRDNQFDKALENNHTLGTVLQAAGYNTVAIGKWGLQGLEGTPPYWPAHPLKRGFNNYFGYMRHMDGHEHYPLEAIYSQNKPVEVWDGYTNITSGLNKCYTTDLWTAYAKKWIAKHQQEKPDEPFFMYLAYDCPHAVLELPTGPYPDGGGLKGGLQWLGQPGHMINTAQNQIDSYVYPEYAGGTYDDDNDPATPEKPWPETFKRYATATRRIDDAVGDLRQLLADLQIDDQTIVVFTSDNGPSIESYLPKSFVPNQPNFFGSYGPFDGIKRDCWEGGLRVPTIAAWPGHFPGGKSIAVPSMLSDWLATFADAAGIVAPARTNGVSLLPVLTGKGVQQTSNIYAEYFEPGRTPNFSQFEASRRGKKRDQVQRTRWGDLVGVRYQVKSADDDFEIYDVAKDPKESRNLAGKPGFQEIQASMKAKALQWRHPDSGVVRPYDAALIPGMESIGVLKAGVSWTFYKGSFPWVASEKGLKSSKVGTSAGITGIEGLPDGMIVYTGLVKIPADGEYHFTAKATGRFYLRLHEATLIDADFGYKPGSQLSGTVYLKAGYHPVKLNLLSPLNTKATVQLELSDKQGKQLPLEKLLFTGAFKTE